MTTYYFIRHAEKDHSVYPDPHLTKEGKTRAENWARILEDKGIDLIYCTHFKRTHETAMPLAKKLGLKLQVYDPKHLYSNDFKQHTNGKTTLVVGHQDTTPAFVNTILGKAEYAYIESANHGNLYRISIAENGQIASELTHVKF